MPEIKNTFTQGKMNKDLDERIVPKGEYKNAVNIQVSTSEDSDVGAAQNILGNTKIGSFLGGSWESVGSIADEKNDVLYSFIANAGGNPNAIVQYAKDGTETLVLVDVNGDILNFEQTEIITGINIIDEFLLWTDGNNEPKKINIQRCIQGNDYNLNNSFFLPTRLIVNETEVFDKEISLTTTSSGTNSDTIELLDTSALKIGDQIISLENSSGGTWFFLTSSGGGPQLRYITAINGNTVTLSDVIFPNGNWGSGSEVVFNSFVDVAEEHITVIKKNPLEPLTFKITPAELTDKDPLFEEIFPRFSYRYKYEDGEYSGFAPFTDVVFNSEYSKDQNGQEEYDQNTAYDTKEPYNAGMRNMIKSIELNDFVSPYIPKDVVQIDILYKQENSNVIYLLQPIRDIDSHWVTDGSNVSSFYKGSYEVKSENIYSAIEAKQLLRPWDNVPKSALAQEVTGNRVVYGNYKQSYDIGSIQPIVNSGYELRFNGFKNESYYTVGNNLLINSGFDNGDATWTSDTNITYNNGTVPPGGIGLNVSPYMDFNVTTNTSETLYQTADNFWEGLGTVYRISFDITNYISGDFEVRLTDGAAGVAPSGDFILFKVDPNADSSPNRTWEFAKTMVVGSNYALSSNGRFSIKTLANGFVGRIDNITVKKQEVDFSIKTFANGGFPSVKSQRNYQLGIVYGDKYGRETPVFTSSESSIVIPWEDTSSITPITSTDLPLASFSLQLKADISTSHPNWASYYKFFVKETSGEYYNLVMDAMYNPTKEDIEKESHVWISFASSDRNKVSEDDYIILKKKVDPNNSIISLQITEENKYRILDVKNEAPDAIKYKYVNMGDVINTGSTGSGLLNNTQANGGLFFDSDFRPLSENNNKILHINKLVWHENGGGRLVDGNDEPGGEQEPVDNLYFSFIKSNPNNIGDNQSSKKKYKVVSVEVGGSLSDPYYIVKLSEPITVSDNNLIKAVPTDDTNLNLHGDITVRFERKLIKDLEAFSGRFFVKILSNNLIKEQLEVNETSLLDVLINYQVEATAESFFHTDTITNTFDIDGGLINNNGPNSVPGTNNVSLVTGGSTGLTTTESEWGLLKTKMDTLGSRFFIDQMHMVAVQTGVYARHATYSWLGGNANNIGDVYNNDLADDPGAGWEVEKFGSNSAKYGAMRWPTNNEIKPQNPTSPNGSYGDNLINGLEGVVTTNSMHVNTDYDIGLRRWRDINWNKNNTNQNLATTYGTSVNTGKHFIHISFLAPGQKLHDGEFAASNSGLDCEWGGNQSTNQTYSIYNNMQGVFGGGVFTGGNNTSNSDANTVAMEILKDHDENSSTPLTICGYGQIDGVGVGGGALTKHETQWDLPQADQDFVNNLKVGRMFRFLGDTNKTIYTIKKSNYNNPKKVYNHTPWRKMWKTDLATGNLVGMGNSVEEATIAWSDTVDGGFNDGSNVDALKQKLEDFGNPNNRRLVYILQLDKNPTDSSVNGNYNPVDGSNIDSITADNIEFIKEDFELNSGEISENPAIWETEPKDNVDLDIYYEAGQAYPTELSIDNVELFAPIGSKVVFDDLPDSIVTENTTPVVAQWGLSEDLNVLSAIAANSDLYCVITSGINAVDNQGNVVNFESKSIKFLRDNGGYTTAKIVNAGGDIYPGVTHVFFKLDGISDKVGLSWYNCFSFGNGIESNRIRDDFNAMIITNGVKASTTSDSVYKEEHRKNGLIYSGIYNSSNGINDLNQFIMAEKITKDLNPTYGSIQKLFSRRISLIAFCEDRVVSITANKNALYNADGNPQLISSNAVLGDANAFVGEFGISQNPESFAKESYRAYFTDRQRGAVLRLSMDGLTPISDAGMSDWFKDEFKDEGHLNVIGSYDNYKKDYNLTFDRGSKSYGEQKNTEALSQTISFSETVKGWTSFKSFIQESGVSMSGDYYTFYEGKCYKHNSNETRNYFYDGKNNIDSSVTFLFNESPTSIKNFNTLNYDGDGTTVWNEANEKYDFTGWQCDSIVTDSGLASQQNGTINEFIKKEGKWFNYIKGDINADLDTQAFNFQGIGVANEIIYSV